MLLKNELIALQARASIPEYILGGGPLDHIRIGFATETFISGAVHATGFDLTEDQRGEHNNCNINHWYEID